MQQNQEIKADKDKPRISLVPPGIVWAIARVREYGANKYGKKESWRDVEPERYRDALLRHVLLWMEDPHGKDAESGLPHIEHIACNVAFLLEVDRHVPLSQQNQAADPKRGACRL